MTCSTSCFVCKRDTERLLCFLLMCFIYLHLYNPKVSMCDVNFFTQFFPVIQRLQFFFFLFYFCVYVSAYACMSVCAFMSCLHVCEYMWSVVHMCVQMHVCMYTHLCAYVWVCEYKCMWVHMSECTHVCVCVFIHLSACMSIFMCMSTCECMWMSLVVLSGPPIYPYWSFCLILCQQLLAFLL